MCRSSTPVWADQYKAIDASLLSPFLWQEYNTSMLKPYTNTTQTGL
jgi:hypothetical protein